MVTGSGLAWRVATAFTPSRIRPRRAGCCLRARSYGGERVKKGRHDLLLLLRHGPRVAYLEYLEL